MSEHSASLPTQYFSELPNIGVISLTGEERKPYLQGQITQDIEHANQHHALLACHCDFKGKTWSNFHVVDYQESLLLIGNHGGLAASLPELIKYGVFSKVEITDVNADWKIYAGYGAEVEAWLNQTFGDTPFEEGQVFSTQDCLVVCFKAPQTRYLVLCKSNADLSLPAMNSDNHLWDLLDIQSGRVNVDAAASNQFVPQMLNMHVLDAISFEKGCYMGQETVARTKYLGKNKRNTFILSGPEQSAISPGMHIEMPVGDNWRRAGTIVNLAHYGETTWMLAVLPSDIDLDNEVRIKELPDASFSVQLPPYPLAD